jgi:hypothetical protein
MAKLKLAILVRLVHVPAHILSKIMLLSLRFHPFPFVTVQIELNNIL